MPTDVLFWLLVLPGIAIGIYAQARIRQSVAKYSRVRSTAGASGGEVARYLLDSGGLQAVAIEQAEGVLGDHYDPRSKTLRLSEHVLFSPTVSAIGIAAHEAGHAFQDADDYFPLELRTFLVPFVQLSAQVAPWIFVAGLMFGASQLTWAGAILFGASSLFALVTLPVEFNASRRALDHLVEHGIIRNEAELEGVRAVLRSAAWTYVGAAVSSIGTWLFYLLLVLGRSAGRRA